MQIQKCNVYITLKEFTDAELINNTNYNILDEKGNQTVRQSAYLPNVVQIKLNVSIHVTLANNIIPGSLPHNMIQVLFMV